MKQLHIAVVNAAVVGYGDPAGNGARLDALGALLQQARGKVDVVALPAGYFTVPDAARVGTLRRKLATLLPPAKVPVIVGVDISGGARGVLAWTPAEGFAGPWRQRSATREDEAESDEVRTVRVRGVKLGVLVSGEMFDASLREAYRTSVRAVIDVGHLARGWTPHRGLRALTREGGVREAFACAHLSGPAPGVQHWYRTGSTRAGEPRRDLWHEGPPWLAGAIYEIGG